MIELKPLSKEAVPRALERAERYRLLNEPAAAESICLDILAVDPGNQQALIALLLARTEQFEEERAEGLAQAREVLKQFKDEYSRAYYAGIICERKGKAQLRQGGPGAAIRAAENMREAMKWYEKAEGLRPSGNDDPLLRWNACARILMRHPELEIEAVEEAFEPPLE
jgi:hypothetical protein